MPDDRIVVVVGVSGSGKTTIGAMLAGWLHCDYAEADDFHPGVNIEKMAAGEPLTDDDRWPWLRAISHWIDQQRLAGQPGVVTSSALKRAYRDFLCDGRPQVQMVYLQGSRPLVAQRLAARYGHFFKASMLDSQYSDLEEPAPDENVVTVSIAGTPLQTVRQIVAKLGQTP